MAAAANATDSGDGFHRRADGSVEEVPRKVRATGGGSWWSAELGSGEDSLRRGEVGGREGEDYICSPRSRSIIFGSREADSLKNLVL